jgi:hypothetical protein
VRAERQAEGNFCGIAGCGDVTYDLARKLCAKHYTAWLNYGDPLASRAPKP